jgi:hypothetical protein
LIDSALTDVLRADVRLISHPPGKLLVERKTGRVAKTPAPISLRSGLPRSLAYWLSTGPSLNPKSDAR